MPPKSPGEMTKTPLSRSARFFRFASPSPWPLLDSASKPTPLSTTSSVTWSVTVNETRKRVARACLPAFVSASRNDGEHVVRHTLRNGVIDGPAKRDVRPRTEQRGQLIDELDDALA